VLSGTARVGPRDRPRLVGAGRSHNWPGDVPHSYAAAGADPVLAVLVVRYPAADPPGGAPGA